MQDDWTTFVAPYYALLLKGEQVEAAASWYDYDGVEFFASGLLSEAFHDSLHAGLRGSLTVHRGHDLPFAQMDVKITHNFVVGGLTAEVVVVGKGRQATLDRPIVGLAGFGWTSLVQTFVKLGEQDARNVAIYLTDPVSREHMLRRAAWLSVYGTEAEHVAGHGS